MTNNILVDKIEEIRTRNLGICIRSLKLCDNEIYILFIPQLSDKQSLCDNIIRPLINHKREDMNIETIFHSIISMDEVLLEDNADFFTSHILRGKTVIVNSSDNKYIVANTLQIESRQISPPELQGGLRVPKDCFNENFDSNISLIRYRIKDEKLKIDTSSVGRRTKTALAIIYIEDIVDNKLLKEVKEKISAIDVDGILDSGYIQKYLEKNTNSFFPKIAIAERSDKACASLLNGEICIIVEGSSLALCFPEALVEFLDSGDDNYDKSYVGIFATFIRIISMLIALTSSSIYVALVSFHPEALPPYYILALANYRASVPTSAFFEAFLMELVVEILREASIRLPKQIGSAIGIVGTIVIGQAAVAAGLVSPLMVIIISLATLASFSVTDYTITHPLRLLKFVMIASTALLGIYGFILTLTFIAAYLISYRTYDTNYLYPIEPLNLKDLKHYLYKNIATTKDRISYLNLKNKRRQK